MAARKETSPATYGCVTAIIVAGLLFILISAAIGNQQSTTPAVPEVAPVIATTTQPPVTVTEVPQPAYGNLETQAPEPAGSQAPVPDYGGSGGGLHWRPCVGHGLLRFCGG